MAFAASLIFDREHMYTFCMRSRAGTHTFCARASLICFSFALVLHLNECAAVFNTKRIIISAFQRKIDRERDRVREKSVTGKSV